MDIVVSIIAIMGVLFVISTKIKYDTMTVKKKFMYKHSKKYKIY
jgi:hypothetical protein